MISSQGKEVDLPNSAVASQTPAGVTVTLSANDEISVDGKVVKAEQLKPALEAALAGAREKIVILRGDQKVVLGKAVNVLDLAQEAGATGIAIATKPPAPGERGKAKK